MTDSLKDPIQRPEPTRYIDIHCDQNIVTTNKSLYTTLTKVDKNNLNGHIQMQLNRILPLAPNRLTRL